MNTIPMYHGLVGTLSVICQQTVKNAHIMSLPKTDIHQKRKLVGIAKGLARRIIK